MALTAFNWLMMLLSETDDVESSASTMCTTTKNSLFTLVRGLMESASMPAYEQKLPAKRNTRSLNLVKKEFDFTGDDFNYIKKTKCSIETFFS